MASLADIWDAPAEEVTRRATPPIDLTANDSPPRGPKRPRSTLFLDSDSEGEGSAQPARKSAPPAAKRSEIDAMFDNLDAEPDAFDDDLPPALDLDALRRQADAKNAQIYKKPSALDLGGPSEDADVGGDAKSKGSGQEKQKKKPLPKLDEARVLGPDGFPALLKQAKTFKPKGKGHEATDLNRLLQVYQYWTHKMYPKTPFRETVKRVEKLCHSKRMHVALTVWRDEYRGVKSGRSIDLGSEDSSDDEEDGDPKSVPTTSKDGDDAALDVTGVELPSSRAPSHPPSSEPPSSDGFDDFDLDAMIREEEERQAAESRASQTGPTHNAPRAQALTTRNEDEDEDEDAAMWDIFKDSVPHDTGPAPTQYADMQGPAPDEDEDMWDVIREMETAESIEHSAPPTAGPPAAAAAALPSATPGDSTDLSATNEEGWDEMYA